MGNYGEAHSVKMDYFDPEFWILRIYIGLDLDLVDKNFSHTLSLLDLLQKHLPASISTNSTIVGKSFVE
jgi:hypothetical protein